MAVAGMLFKVTPACLPDYTPISVSTTPGPSQPLSHRESPAAYNSRKALCFGKGASHFVFLIHLKSCRAGRMKESQEFNLGTNIVGVC